MNPQLILSDERQMHFAKIITDGVWGDDLVDFSDDDEAMRIARKAIGEFVQEHLDIDEKAREKVLSLKRNVVEGSPEWDILHRKYYEEERWRRGKN